MFGIRKRFESLEKRLQDLEYLQSEERKNTHSKIDQITKRVDDLDRNIMHYILKNADLVDTLMEMGIVKESDDVSDIVFVPGINIREMKRKQVIIELSLAGIKRIIARIFNIFSERFGLSFSYNTSSEKMENQHKIVADFATEGGDYRMYLLTELEQDGKLRVLHGVAWKKEEE